ncbi:RusA family crossover junction endodeoxyribonuclease [Bacillus mycoides]|uniref:RusA family crossover junction endodeoxyribonuclease n=1 Tax=Bacillus mycoides TaxID=1405 RepID=UPI003D015CEA
MKFEIIYDSNPISVNNYLRPSAVVKGGKAFVHMYETKESKDWKKRFIAYLKREMRKQNWNVEATKSGHWFLECYFIQSRTNQDSNNYFKILADSLTEAGVIDDDKNLLVQVKRVLYDAKKPRFYAVLRPVEYTGIFNNEKHYNQFFEDNCFNCKKDSEKCAILRKAKEGRIQEDIEQDNKGFVCKKRKG